jgi:hypothetical protein
VRVSHELDLVAHAHVGQKLVLRKPLALVTRGE